MDPNETMVEQEETGTEADDTLQEGELVEETDESEDETLSSILEEDEQPEEEKPKQQDSQGTSEPGWIRKRVDKAVQKAVAETEARMQAMFDQQMAPIREKMLTQEAEDLVRKGVVKDLDTARELVRYRQGLPAQQPANQPAPQARDEKGRFQPKEDPAISARIDMLAHQADTIKDKRGLDVIEVFNTNEDVKQRVISGELDFYDVAELMSKPAAKKKAPAPMRSPNGASGYTPTPISTMTDEQFEKLEKRIQAGARISLK